MRILAAIMAVLLPLSVAAIDGTIIKNGQASASSASSTAEVDPVFTDWAGTNTTSVTNWSQNPALGTVNMGSNDLNHVKKIYRPNDPAAIGSASYLDIENGLWHMDNFMFPQTTISFQSRVLYPSSPMSAPWSMSGVPYGSMSDGSLTPWEHVTNRVYLLMVWTTNNFLLRDGSLPMLGHLRVGASNVYDIGSLELPFRSLYLGTNTIFMDGVPVLRYDSVNTQLVSAVPVVEQASTSSPPVLYLTNEPAFLASPASDIGVSDTQKWTQAYGWGDHGTNNYFKADGSVPMSGNVNLGGNAVSNGTWLGNPIGGGYVAYTRTNITHTHVLTAVTTTNTTVALPYPGCNVSWGKMYAIETNTTARTATVTFYANNDYKGSNAYWRATMPIVVVPITNSAAAGNTRLQTSDGSGFAVNDLVFTCDSNEFARIAAITNNDLYLEDALLYPHGTTSSVSKVSEFGGFTTIDWTATSNAWHRIAFTNTITQTIRCDLSIRR